MTDGPRIIQGKRFIDALLAAGVVTPGERVTRVVIDARVDHITTVYVERYGDERLLDVVSGLPAAEVREVPA